MLLAQVAPPSATESTLLTVLAVAVLLAALVAGLVALRNNRRR